MPDALKPDVVKPDPAPVAPAKSLSVANYLAGVGKGLGQVLVDRTLPGKVFLGPLIEGTEEKKRRMLIEQHEQAMAQGANTLAIQKNTLLGQKNDLEMFPIKKQEAQLGVDAANQNLLRSKLEYEQLLKQTPLQDQETNQALARSRQTYLDQIVNAHEKTVEQNAFNMVNSVHASQFPGTDNLTEEDHAYIHGPSNADAVATKELMTMARMATSGDKDDAAALPRYMDRHGLEIVEANGAKVIRDKETGMTVPYDLKSLDTALTSHLRTAVSETNGRIQKVKNTRTAVGRTINTMSSWAISRGLVAAKDEGKLQIAIKDALLDGVPMDSNTPSENKARIAKEVAGLQAISQMNEFSMATDPDVKRDLFEQVAASLGGDEGVALFGGKIRLESQPEDPGVLDPWSMKVKFIRDTDGVNPPWSGTVPELVQMLTLRNPASNRLAQLFAGLQDEAALREDIRDDKKRVFTDKDTGEAYRIITAPDGTKYRQDIPMDPNAAKPAGSSVDVEAATRALIGK